MQAPRGGLAKHAATNGADTAVAYWGGRVRIFRGEALASEVLLDQDVSALAWTGGRVVAALADGRVQAIESP